MKIKKLFLTLGLMGCFCMATQAQGLPTNEVVPASTFDGPVIVNRPYTLSVGPKIGVNFAFAGDPSDMDLGIKGGVGFLAGLGADLRFGRPEGRPVGTERFGVQLEALYAMETLKTHEGNINFNCIDIPLLFQWYFVPQFAIEIGPTFSGASSSAVHEYNLPNQIVKIDHLKYFDVKVSVGLNCQLKNGFTADIRYNIGTSNLHSNLPTKVSTLSIGVGWFFNVVK